MGLGLGLFRAEVRWSWSRLPSLQSRARSHAPLGAACISIPGMNHGKIISALLRRHRKLVYNNFDHHLMLVVSRKSAQTATYREHSLSR